MRKLLSRMAFASAGPSFYFLLRQIKPYWKSSALAGLGALLLGIVAAAEGLVIGQFLQGLGSLDNQSSLKVIDAFDPSMAPIMKSLIGDLVIDSAAVLMILPLTLLILSTLKTFLQSSGFWVWELNAEKISRNLRANLVQRYLQMSLFAKQDRGEWLDQNLAAVLTNDLKMTRDFIVHFFGGLPRELAKLICFLLVLILLSPIYLAYVIVLILPAALLVKKLGKKLRRRSRSALDQFGEVSEWMQDRLRGMETIKHYHTESYEIEKMTGLFDRLTKKFSKAAKAKAMSGPVVECFGFVGIALVLYAVLDTLAMGQNQTATGISFFTILGLMGQSANQVSRYYSAHKEASAAADRLYELEAKITELKDLRPRLPSKKQDAKESISQSWLVRAQGIGFTYPKMQVPALQTMSFQFEMGRFYTVLGRTGSGKSTLLRILMELYPPSQGEVQHRVPDFGYMPQTLTPAPASLAENIAYPDLNYDRGRVLAALNEVALQGLVDDLPEGLDTDLVFSARPLSGGQLQRVLLARLFYHRYPIVFIDEGTSALDPANEELILSGLKRYCQQQGTIVMITHRLKPLEFSDETLVLAKGQLRFAGASRDLTNQQLEVILAET